MIDDTSWRLVVIVGTPGGFYNRQKSLLSSSYGPSNLFVVSGELSDVSKWGGGYP